MSEYLRWLERLQDELDIITEDVSVDELPGSILEDMYFNGMKPGDAAFNILMEG